MGTIGAPGYGRPLADDTSLSCVSGFAAMPNGEVRSICWYCNSLGDGIFPDDG